MRRATRIAGIALQGVVVTACLAAATFFLLPRMLGWRVVTVMSGSMAPAYPVDAVLAVDPVAPADIEVGDVIAFQTERDRPLVTHRVVAVKNDGNALTFVTKGDANEEPDRDAVSATAVRGRVAFGVPHLGLFVRVVHAPLGFATLFALPGFLLLGLEILEIRRERRHVDAAEDNVGSDVTVCQHVFTALPKCPWPPPQASALVSRPAFDVWNRQATRDRCSAEPDREVRTWKHFAH